MKLTHQRGGPKDLQLLEVNARFMRHETFQALVRNIRRDGALSQWPLVYLDASTGTRTVLSGNHRVKAAIAAGLTEIDWIETDEYLTQDQQVALQLSHNALVGEDDLSILKRLYQSIEDVDERVYAGLDDQVLDLMAQVDADSLAEANLDFVTVQIVFLPHERDRAEEAFAEAKRLTSADGFWLARLDQHSKMLTDIELARVKAGDVPADNRWRALELWAADYLSGA